MLDEKNVRLQQCPKATQIKWINQNKFVINHFLITLQSPLQMLAYGKMEVPRMVREIK